MKCVMVEGKITNKKVRICLALHFLNSKLDCVQEFVRHGMINYYYKSTDRKIKVKVIELTINTLG